MKKLVDKKYTVSIDPALSSEVENYIKEHPQVSKSSIFEQGLRLWHEERVRQQWQDYYDNLAASEKEEDKAWVALGRRAAQVEADKERKDW